MYLLKDLFYYSINIRSCTMIGNLIFGLSLSLFLLLQDVHHSFAHNQEGKVEWIEKLEKLQTKQNYKNQWMKNNAKPVSVHQLRPQDIDVVGAMGDSITAGYGIEATNFVEIGVEERGLSWTIGGDQILESAITIPNILKKFNPDIKGYSIGNDGDKKNEWFNVAVGGARALDMPDQARDLISRMQNDTRTNFDTDWKIVSIFIGGNDLCALRRSEDATPENYIKYLEEALDILHEELPRTLINVVEILEIYVLPEVGKAEGATAVCRSAQTTFCNYVVTANETELEDIKKQNRQYQTPDCRENYVGLFIFTLKTSKNNLSLSFAKNQTMDNNYMFTRKSLTEQLIGSGKYDTRQDFTVVLQPFFNHTVLPYTEDGDVDVTFFAPDCFHFSDKGHAMGALNLWNNMLEPVGNKTTMWGIADLKCPTEENPFIFTRLNSGAIQPATETFKSKNVGKLEVESDSEEVWLHKLETLQGLEDFSQTSHLKPRATGTEDFGVEFPCVLIPLTTEASTTIGDQDRTEKTTTQDDDSVEATTCCGGNTFLSLSSFVWMLAIVSSLAIFSSP